MGELCSTQTLASLLQNAVRSLLFLCALYLEMLYMVFNYIGNDLHNFKFHLIIKTDGERLTRLHFARLTFNETVSSNSRPQEYCEKLQWCGALEMLLKTKLCLTQRCPRCSSVTPIDSQTNIYSSCSKKDRMQTCANVSICLYAAAVYFQCRYLTRYLERP